MAPATLMLLDHHLMSTLLTALQPADQAELRLTCREIQAAVNACVLCVEVHCNNIQDVLRCGLLARLAGLQCLALQTIRPALHAFANGGCRLLSHQIVSKSSTDISSSSTTISTYLEPHTAVAWRVDDLLALHRGLHQLPVSLQQLRLSAFLGHVPPAAAAALFMACLRRLPPSLTSLHINRFSSPGLPAIPQALSHLCRLQSLTLSGLAALNDAGLAALVDQLPRLHNLELSADNALAVTAAGFASLSSLGSLTMLCVELTNRHSAASCEVLRGLCSVTALRSLRCLQHSGPASDGPLLASLALLPQLEELGISLQLSVQDEGWSFTVDSPAFKTLQRVALRLHADDANAELPHVPPASVPRLLDFLRRLKVVEHIALANCWPLPREAFALLADLVTLRSIQVFGDLRSLQDSHLSLWARRLPCLERLQLFGCDAVSDGGLRELAHGTAPLKHFEVALCGGITPQGLGALIDGCGTLRTLAMEHLLVQLRWGGWHGRQLSAVQHQASQRQGCVSAAAVLGLCSTTHDEQRGHSPAGQALDQRVGHHAAHPFLGLERQGAAAPMHGAGARCSGTPGGSVDDCPTSRPSAKPTACQGVPRSGLTLRSRVSPFAQWWVEPEEGSGREG